MFRTLLTALNLLLISSFTLADDAQIAALTAADDARIAAMKTPTKEALTALFSEDLHYAHSNGIIDTKASFIEVLTSGTTQYLGYDHQQRQFSFPAPGIALMTGQTRIQAETAKGQVDSILSYLAVWRLEDGQWRFLAWQSCRLPPATP
jgi:ketosteroid isomerase-like protein